MDKSKMKGLLPSIAVIVFMLAIMTMGSFSLFTSSVGLQSQITMGTMYLGISKSNTGPFVDGGTVTFVASNVAPTGSIGFVAFVKNTGTLPATITYTVTGVPAPFGYKVQYDNKAWAKGSSLNIVAGQIYQVKLIIKLANAGNSQQGVSFTPVVTITATT